MPKPTQTKSVTDRAMQWTSIICMPLLLIVLTALWSVGGTMSAFASDNEVLKVRVDQTEQGMLEIKSSIDKLSVLIQQLAIAQSTNTAEVKHLQKDLKDFIRPKDPKN